MTNTQITTFLRQLNAWRRDEFDEMIPMPDPNETGLVIDAAIERINAQEAALLPFARLAGDFTHLPDSTELTVNHTSGFTGLCVGDVRKAKGLT